MGVYLQQDRAVINGVEYKRGDSIQRDKEGTLYKKLLELQI